MLLFLSTNIVNFINLIFSWFLLKLINPEFLSTINMYIAIQLALFLVFSGEQNAITSSVARHAIKPSFTTRTTDLVGAILFPMALAVLVLFPTSLKPAGSIIVFILGILLARNLMQFRGVLLGKQQKFRFSASIICENLCKLVMFYILFTFDAYIYDYVVILSLTPSISWMIERVKVHYESLSNGEVVAPRSEIKLGAFLLIQILFFAFYDLPYILRDLLLGKDKISSDLAFLGIFAKIIFFASSGFSLALIARFSNKQKLPSAKSGYYKAIVFVFCLTLFLALVFWNFAEELILIISQPSYVTLSNHLPLVILNAGLFTVSYIALSLIATQKHDWVASNSIAYLLMAVTLTAFIGFDLIEISGYLGIQGAIFLTIFGRSHFKLIRSIINK